MCRETLSFPFGWAGRGQSGCCTVHGCPQPWDLCGRQVLPAAPPPFSRGPGPVFFGCSCVVRQVGFCVFYLIETFHVPVRAKSQKNSFPCLEGGRRGHRKPSKNCPYAPVPPCLHQAGRFHHEAANLWKVSRSLV